MNLEHKLETIYKNRMEVKYNNALVREQMQKDNDFVKEFTFKLGKVYRIYNDEW